MVVGEIQLHESAMCSEKIGINCSCFSVEDGGFEMVLTYVLHAFCVFFSMIFQ